MKLPKKRRLLNSYESILFAYLLMFFSLVSSRYEYFECLNCDLNYKLIVSMLFSIVFVSYLILTLNAFFNKQRKTICISTHVIEQVKELCSHIIVLKEGGVILNDSVQNLLSRSTKYEMESDNIQNTKQKLSSIKDLVIVHETKTKLIIDSKLSLNQMLKTLHTDSTLHGINKQHQGIQIVGYTYHRIQKMVLQYLLPAVIPQFIRSVTI